MTNQVAISGLFFLGDLSFDQGDFYESSRVYGRIVSHCENNPNEFSQKEKAQIYNQYGLALKRSGNILEAEKSYLKANELSEYEDPCYLNNIAVNCFEIGKYTQSEKFYQKAISILERSGDDPHGLSLYRSNLGTLYTYMGNFFMSKELLLQSLEDFESIGKRSDIAHTQYRIGHLMYMMGYFSDAIVALRIAYKAKRSIYSNNHSRVADILFTLGEVFIGSRKPQKAEVFISKALSIYKKQLAPRAIQIGRCHLRLAEIRTLRGFSDGKIKENMKKTYIFFKSNEPNNNYPDMANYYALRGEILMYEKRYRRALNYLKKSLKIRQALLNPIHPDIAMTFNHIGHCHFKLNKIHEARRAYINSLRIFKQIHLKHCWLPFLLSNIAKIYKNKKIGDLCLKYGQKIAVDTPRLIDDVNLPELTNSDVTTSEQKLDTEIIPEIRITLVGTSDMRKPLMCLSEKVRSLIDYYSNEVPSISFSCYFQGCENSHEIFETLMCQSTMKNFSELFVGLVGKQYDQVINSELNIPKDHSWLTNYRDRANWEIIIRKLINVKASGTVYHLDKRVFQSDIQNPFLKIQTFIKEISDSEETNQILVEKIRKKKSKVDAEYIMYQLNQKVLDVKKRFVQETFTGNV